MGRNIDCHGPPPPILVTWINDHDDEFTPITVQNFDRKYNTYETKFGPIPQNPIGMRADCLEFKTEAEAKKHSYVLLEHHCSMLDQEILTKKEELRRAKERLKERKPSILGRIRSSRKID